MLDFKLLFRNTFDAIQKVENFILRCALHRLLLLSHFLINNQCLACLQSFFCT